jgi:alpha-D-ribose 1-methylphosphonate 5-triphosphate synthase subunit PhnG
MNEADPSTESVAQARARRCELLAAADAQALVDTADACLVDAPDPVALIGPDVGSVVLTVREPVEATRFHLADVLVTRFEVEHRGHRGWAMRMGDDRPGAVAAAICDAERVAQGPHAHLVDELCRHTESRLDADRQREWRDLAATVVTFEEMTE